MPPLQQPARDGDAERDLVARVRAGDERAFEAIVVAHYAEMCHVAAAVLRSRDAVEDIVQDVLRRVWTRRAQWDTQVSVRAYLVGATRNEAVSVVRKMRRERGLAGRIAEQLAGSDDLPWMARPEPRLDDAAVSAELKTAILRAAASLPDRVREAFFLRWDSGLRVAEIAARMGTSANTVEVQLTRAFRSIRDRLKEIGLP